MSNEQERGAKVAWAAWSWLQHQKTIQFVPWVLDPKSDKYDPVKAEKQEIKDKLLESLERVLREAC